ncbi:PTI1-like tyrosine-protein kinase At3g15890 [Durio zibethinus]|uniref:PTI1-like tyrosine-protein kinase At3g15890 n=1 Tax=Durio zibethinus TaxID=66656 RepID=A0A6P5WZV3_DURZI|nr:PTI1-like tyrosine-protein kinase At3g15890 [Durio zibethinus]
MICCGKGMDRKEKGKKQPTWRIFSMKELHSTTDNFNYDNKLEEGGFGSVYWCQLLDGSQNQLCRWLVKGTSVKWQIQG